MVIQIERKMIAEEPAISKQENLLNVKLPSAFNFLTNQ